MKLIAPASQITGMGHYAPSRCIDNAHLETQLQLDAGWIERRTGIKMRRWARDDETLINLATHASSMALEQSGIATRDIGLTILATSTPDRLLPPTAPLLAYRLGLPQSGAFDLSGACVGFLNALTLADSFARIQGKSVLVVAANILSRRINFTERDSAVLFADAAGAVVITPTMDATKGLLGAALLSDGSSYDLMTIAAGGSEQPFCPHIPLESYKMNMRDGRAIFGQAVQMMTDCAEKALADADIKSNDIHRFIPHQANLRITDSVSKKLGIPPTKTVSTLAEYGNSSAATIPLSLSISHQKNPFAVGEKLLLVAAGAGMTAAALVYGI